MFATCLGEGGMKIFLTYASEHKAAAEPIAFSLRSRGHKVFLDKDDLPAGRGFDEQIENAIGASDMLLFLISSESVMPGRYTLTELEFARRKWRNPDGHVLPVMIQPTEMHLVPDYLKAVTVLEPKGNAAAEVAASVRETEESANRGLLLFFVGAALVSGLLSVAAVFTKDFGIQYFIKSWYENNVGGMFVPGVAFGLAVCVVLFLKQHVSVLKLLLTFLVIQVTWHLAFRTTLLTLDSFQLATNGKPATLSDFAEHPIVAVPGFFVGGAMGGFGTWAAAALSAFKLRSLEGAVLTTVTGFVASTATVLAVPVWTQIVIFPIWQPLIAASLAYGILRYR